MFRRWIFVFFLLALAIQFDRFLSAPAFQTDLGLNDAMTKKDEPPAEPPLLRPVKDSPRDLKPPQVVPLQVQRAPTPAFSRTLTILVVGIDRRPGQKYGGRPDTIVVAALDKNEGHLGLISVPRDLYVEIPEHGMDRINATFSVALRRKENTLSLLKRVLQDTLQLPISHTLAIDLGGFEQLIDSIGGVDVHVPCPIADNFIDQRTATGRRTLDVESGLQHLDGVAASLYVRSRHGRSDWSRARRQQAVLFSILRRFKSIDGISRLPEFLDTLGPLIASDMSRSDVVGLMRWASSVEPDRVHGVVLGVKQASPHYTEDGKAVLIPHFEEIDKSLRGLFSSPTPGERPTGAPCPARNVALKRPSPRRHSP